MGKFETAEQLENYTMAQQTKKYMTKKRRNLYIPLEKYDLVFDESEVTRMKTLWRENKSLNEIAEEMGRHEMEIAVLIMDQGDKQRINKRSMGLGA
ncbi:helix-turn-helix domain-containing protein [Bacillus cereus]|nr:helix-turn-helix domain-containing protein [Bacillus cereus]MDA2225470.1 helix-turn-helix domain-containing protein [Bacillus cereus]MDA2281025.1 helix-turn-helix domain-containing protein [Bacillus cereus]MDA2722252.1 helix-turn-helix domain-containing protein [Bacillus cereus]MDA2727901.1 helix-turn-helix domain-containing protein [Bacillus cereus]